MSEQQEHGKIQQRRSRAEVEQLVDAFESSGLRRREFCRKHGVALGTLDLWRKRRRQERGEVASKRRQKHEEVAGYRRKASGVPAMAGVESRVRLVAVEPAGAPASAGSGGLAVVVSRGRRIEVSPGFDTATLERLLGVLEQE